MPTDQILLEAENGRSPVWATAEVTLKGGVPILVRRPIRPADEVALSEIFCSHSKETTYNR